MPNDRRPRRPGFLARRKIPHLAATLRDANLGYRYRTDAARALAEIGGDMAVDALLTQVYTSPLPVQRSVVMALGHIGDQRSASTLLQLLGRTRGQVHKDTLAALRRTGLPPDLGPLITGLGKRSGPALSADAMGELVDLFGDPVVPMIVATAADPAIEIGVRLGALRTVVSRRLAGAEDVLRRALEDPAPELRSAALDALAGFGTDDWTGEVIAALTTDESSDVRRAALAALARLPDSPRAIDAVVGRLGDEDPRVGCAAFDALAALAGSSALLVGQRAREAANRLAPFLQDDRLSRRNAAAELLARLGWEPPDDGTRAAYLAAGGDWGRVADTGRSGVVVLLEWLDRADLDPPHRQSALGTLLRVADSEVEAVAEGARAGSGMALRALRWLAGSQQPSARRAAEVLAEIRAERRGDLSAELGYEPEWAQPEYDDDPWGYDAWEAQRWERRVAAASTLAQLGDPQGIRALRDALRAGGNNAMWALTRVGGVQAAQVLEEAGLLDALTEVRAAPDYPPADAHP